MAASQLLEVAGGLLLAWPLPLGLPFFNLLILNSASEGDVWSYMPFIQARVTMRRLKRPFQCKS